jgi:alkylresorcinol/alkylpyrone synthase
VRPSTFLGFGTALPEHQVTPEVAQLTLGRLWPRLRAGAAGAAGAGEATRYTVEPLERVIAPHSLGEAMRIYAHHAPRLAREAACQALAAARTSPEQVDMVISVSCTGYMVPSLEVRLAHETGMRADVIRVPITELGCSGGAAAVALAHRHLQAYPQHRVLVVAVELASLSFRPGDRSLDNLTASMVFGDGAAAAVLGGGDRTGLQVLATESRIWPDTSEVLGFDLRDDGFHVVLDRRLPRVIEGKLQATTDEFIERHCPDPPGFYAVHAGGPRIFDAVESALGLDPDALATSRGVFQDVGNLSSASILFCLAALPEVAGDGLAVAFGPGLTVELAHLRRSPG